MATSKETVSQVRNILRMLDRRIDSAREQRLGAGGHDDDHLPQRAAPQQRNGDDHTRADRQAS